MYLLAAPEDFLGSSARTLRSVLELAGLVPLALVWVRSRNLAQPVRGVVRATAAFAVLCVAAVLGAEYLTVSGPAALATGAALVTAGAVVVVRALRPHGTPAWQPHLDRLRVLDAALNASRDGVLVTASDPDTAGLQILYANPAFEELTGYGTDEAVGQSPSMLYDENSQAEKESVHEALRADTPGRFEVLARRKDGSRVWVEWHVVPVPATVAGDTYRIAVLRDVTERRRLEEQLRNAAKLEAMGRLAAGIAHDFNNILMVIGGSAELLREGTAGLPAAAPLVDEIRFATERAGQLVRQLLTFGRPGAAAPQVLDLNRVTADLTEILRRTIGSGIRTEVSPAPEPLWVKADRSQLEQVVLNLAVNARDAMPQGGHLRLRLLRAGGRARLEVADTGTGMSAQVRERIFEPFFTTKGPDKGTGLGLATVFQVVRTCGGTIAVESAPGAGTTFRIDLPLSAAPPAPPPSEPRPAADRPGGARRPALLVVEDEPEIRLLARAVLGARFQVTEAADGAVALGCLDSGQQFDLVLTDVRMPGATGDQVAARARALQPDVGIVFMSGFAESAPSVPGSVFVAKPFHTADLLRAVEAALAGEGAAEDENAQPLTAACLAS